jgi:hypothetical protein
MLSTVMHAFQAHPQTDGFFRQYANSVIQWSEFLASDPEVSGSIPSATRLSKKQWIWNGFHSGSWGSLESYLNEKVVAPV